jgi:hypothetical protein
MHNASSYIPSFCYIVQSKLLNAASVCPGPVTDRGRVLST